jgi:hypothetical protein
LYILGREVGSAKPSEFPIVCIFSIKTGIEDDCEDWPLDIGPSVPGNTDTAVNPEAKLEN